MKYYSYAGYIGAISLILLTLSILNFNISFLSNFSFNEKLFVVIGLTFLSMLIFEYFSIKKYNNNNEFIKENHKKRDNKNILISSFVRYISILSVIFIMHQLTYYHYYFQKSHFVITKEFFELIFNIYMYGGFFYNIAVLYFKGDLKYDFNDYGVLTFISYKAFLSIVIGKLFRNKKLFNNGLLLIKNKRIKKIWLVYLVNFFFLTLMVYFFKNEINAFSSAYNQVMHSNFNNYTFFKQYHTVYLMLYHSLFVIDVGVAIIGYTIATRWLNNRTKSVDMTFSGWLLAIMCYPPMNSGFTDQFIGYGKVPTHNIVTSETILMVLMAGILICRSG